MVRLLLGPGRVAGLIKRCMVCLDRFHCTLFPPRNDGKLDRRYSNEQLVVTLPDGVTACDIGSLTVWCEPFRATFSRITIPRSTFVSELLDNYASFLEKIIMQAFQRR